MHDPPTTEIEGCRRSHAVLVARLGRLDDPTARRPSRLPGWSVGHVLTHLARNADSVVRRLEGAARGEVVDQYVGGAAGRAAEIEAGAGRPAAELVEDVSTSAARVDEAAAAFPDDAWGRLTRSVSGREQPAAFTLFSRWREVEVHHADLGLGYMPADWPPELVTRWLPWELPALADRADPTELLVWILDRGPSPTLAPW